MGSVRSNIQLALVSLFVTQFALLAQSAGALTIVSYDLQPSSGLTLMTTTVDPGFSASSLNAVGVVSTGLTNHFYHSGWLPSPSSTRYYEFSISAPAYTLDELLFSAELSAGSATYRLRSSLDGFVSDINVFSQSGGLVMNREIDLSSLGVLNGTTVFRYYLSASSFQVRAGFANHEVGGAGGGASDVGRDIFLTGNLVPEPTTAILLCFGLMGLARTQKARR